MIVVRELADGDEAAAGRVVRAGYLALAGYPADPKYDAIIADVAARRHHTTVAVAESDGEVVGCLTYVASHEHPDAEHGDPDAATFRYFAVDPSAQGRGVGQAMLDWVVARARADGKSRLRLHTLQMMHAAQRLYARNGFVRDSEHDEDWDGIVGLAYRLDL